MLYACTLLSFTAHAQKRSTTMDNVTIKQFFVIGISTRTTNENGQSATDIEALWTKFWKAEIQKEIVNRTSDDIYAVYTDYESDFKGPYTLTIGFPVTSLENIPPGYVGKTIAVSTYKKFVSKGKMPEAVFGTWLEIWGDSSLNRAYSADFTIHGRKYYDGNKAEVETYISIVQ